MKKEFCMTVITLLIFITLLTMPLFQATAKEESFKTTLEMRMQDHCKISKNQVSSEFEQAIVWSAQYDRNEEDVSRNIILDSKENIITTGYTASIETNETDFLILKYDAEGNLLWDAIIDRGTYDYSWDTAVDSEDNIILFGINSSMYAEDISDLNVTLYLLKYNKDGVELWNKSIDIEEDGFPGGIAVDSHDNIILTIGKGNLDSMAFFCYTIKMDENGNELWNTTYTEDMLSIGFDVVVNENDDIFVGGLVASFYGQGWFISKYDSSGTRHWTQPYNIGNNLNDLKIDTEGNLIIAGQTFSRESNSTKWINLKCDSKGGKVWVYEFDGVYHESANDIALDTNNNIFILGTIFMEDSYEHCILTLDPQGNELCMKKPIIDGSYLGITINSENTLIATGVINNSDDTYDVDCYLCTFQDNTPPKVDLFSPEKGHLYLFNSKLFPFFGKTVILGTITLSATIANPEDVEQALFYIDGIKQASIDSPPYEWTWEEKNFGKHHIEIQVCDENYNMKRETMSVFTLF